MKWGLVLQGGGVRTAYVTGVIEYLTRTNLQPTHISASSAAVLSALFFLSGQTQSLRQLWEIAISADVVDPKQFRKKKYVFDNHRLLELLNQGEHAFDIESFKTTITPLYTPVLDTKHFRGRFVEVEPDSLKDSVLAAIAHPLAHPAPYAWADTQWYDGGFYFPVPVEALWGKAFDALVVVRTDNLSKTFNQMELTPIERAYMKLPGALGKLWKIMRRRIVEEEIMVDELSQIMPVCVVSPSEELPASLVNKNMNDINTTIAIGLADAERQLESFLQTKTS